MNQVAHGAPGNVLRLQTPALVVGAIGLALSAIGWLTNAQQFFRSYLVAFVFVAGISLGSLTLLMLQHLTGGVWGILIRRPLEAAARNFPLLAIAFVPVALGLHELYIWSHQDLVEHDHLLQIKAPYLNATFFIARTAGYFVLWIVMTMLLTRWSKQQEQSSSPWIGQRLRYLSAAGLPIMGLTLTFTSIDWMMSLEPHWVSTMYGISFIVGCGLSAFAFTISLTVLMAGQEPISLIAQPIHFRDLGNLMFAFVMLWAYTAFSQFMLIWYANIREEVPWYTRRMMGGWGVIAGILIIFHFFLPFFALLLRAIKDRPRSLGIVAMLVVAMRALDIFWLMAPGYYPEQIHAPFAIHWLDPVTILGLGGIWFFFFLRTLSRESIVPFNEPYVQEALSHG